MGVYINASPHRSFRLVTDYLASRGVKVLASDAPYYVNAEFGSKSVSPSGTMGKVKITIGKSNSESILYINYTFLKTYVVNLAIGIAGAVAVYLLLWWLGTANPLGKEFTLAQADWLAMFLVPSSIFLVIIASMFVTSLARKRFSKELIAFLNATVSEKNQTS